MLFIVLERNVKKFAQTYSVLQSWTDQMESGNHNDEKHVTNGDGADIATNGTDFPVRSSTVITSSQVSVETYSEIKFIFISIKGSFSHCGKR